MATKRQVVKRCAELSVVMDDLSFDCPLGTCLGGSGLHWLDKDHLLGMIPKSEIWDDILDEISWGLEDCPGSCQHCQDQFEAFDIPWKSDLSIKENALLHADKLEESGDTGKALALREVLTNERGVR